MDIKTLRVIGFFQQVFCELDCDPEERLEKLRSRIKPAGRVFEYLELAKSDERSPLGWKPSKRLLDLITKRKSPKHTTRSTRGMKPFVLNLMLDVMLGVDNSWGASFRCCVVLAELGLVYQDRIGNWVPRIALADLFVPAYYTRARRKPGGFYFALAELPNKAGKRCAARNKLR